MYKRQIYQIAESNRIEKNRFGSENRLETFSPNWNAQCTDGIDSFIIKPVNNETQKHLLSEENLTKYVMHASMFQFLLFLKIALYE